MRENPSCIWGAWREGQPRSIKNNQLLTFSVSLQSAEGTTWENESQCQQPDSQQKHSHVDHTQHIHSQTPGEVNITEKGLLPFQSQRSKYVGHNEYTESETADKSPTPHSKSRPLKEWWSKYINMVLNIHRNHKAY